MSSTNDAGGDDAGSNNIESTEEAPLYNPFDRYTTHRAGEHFRHLVPGGVVEELKSYLKEKQIKSDSKNRKANKVSGAG